MPGVAIRDPDLGAVVAQHLFCHALGPTRGDFVQHRPVGNEHPCQWVEPSTRVVVSSEAMTRAVSNLVLIAARAASRPLRVRRKALAMAPSEIVSPNNSFSIRDRRSKPT